MTLLPTEETQETQSSKLFIETTYQSEISAASL